MSTTNSEVSNYTFQNKTGPLCPFRKRTYFMKTYGEQEFNISSNKAEFIEERFLPCIKERCMKFNRVTGCGI